MKECLTPEYILEIVFSAVFGLGIAILILVSLASLCGITFDKED